MSDSELVEAALADPSRNFGPIIEQYKNAVFGVSLARPFFIENGKMGRCKIENRRCWM